MSTSANSYITGFDEVRAVASIAVVVHHIELYKFRQNDPSLFDTNLFYFIDNLGHNAVMLFFALSGFLITWLLVQEKDKTGSINIKTFYFRRAARILPLYYLLILASCTAMPALASLSFTDGELHFQNLIGNLSFNEIFLYFLVLPNVAISLGMRVAGLSQSWSIGVEEQFYLAWPHVIKNFSIKHLPWILLIFALIKSFFLNNIESYFPFIRTFPYVQILIRQFAIEYMALGGLSGWLLYYHPFSTNKKRRLFLASLILPALLSFFFQIPPLVQAAIFSAALLGVANSIGSKDTFLSKIGQKSYGIYMYHPILMFISFAITRTFMGSIKGLWPNLILYISVISTTTLVSWLSFEYIETPIRKYILEKYRAIGAISTLANH
ncbi:acyltransferase family protein [Bdellovibrio bacteriovorus]|uniref:Acyltransferase n=1 Tax=Bdellovibrio bacteriovorus str. Tiberius TaxID=1069642 RepID=K7YXB0_BDEBC|nr:acyltransferase [Bdellovibrio bacteriovorus]AFY01360.1 acyltransferase [Bdellovibrio bacteriovorus str. Tiberius]